MKYINRFILLLVVYIGFLFSPLTSAQPAGLLSPQQGDLVFQDQLEIYHKPFSVELNGSMETEGPDPETTSANHLDQLKQLGEFVTSLGGEFFDANDLELDRRSGFLNVRSPERVGQSTFTISARTQAVSDGDLGTWDASALTTGDYQLRIVVVDNIGQELPPCVIAVRVVTP